MYSKEEGTMAATLKKQIPQKIKSMRYNKIMEEDRAKKRKMNRMN